MPLKIICSNCHKELISKFLKKGDSIYCKHCNNETLIDDKAVNVSEEDADKIIEEERIIEETPSENQRYEYKFIELKIEHNFFSNNLPGDYTKIIESHAKDGWRFIQLFPIEFSGYHPSAFQLVFEKEL